MSDMQAYLVSFGGGMEEVPPDTFKKGDKVILDVAAYNAWYKEAVHNGLGIRKSEAVWEVQCYANNGKWRLNCVTSPVTIAAPERFLTPTDGGDA